MAILQADARHESSEADWDAALAAKDAHPVFATIAILVAMIIAAIAIGRIDTSAGMVRTLGLTLGPALILWGVAYAVTIRHASLAWQLGSLAAVIAAGLLYFTGVMGSASLAAKRDLAMLAEMRIDAQGITILPPDADRGPASRVFIGHFAQLNAIVRDRQQLIATTGLDVIADPQAVRRDPALLRDCGRFARAQGKSNDDAARLAALLAALPGKMERAGIEPIMRQQLLAGMNAGVLDTQAKLRVAATRMRALFGEAGSVCTVLARRHWVAQGPSFAFTSASDMCDYDRHIIAFNAVIQQDRAADLKARRMVVAGRAKIRSSF